MNERDELRANAYLDGELSQTDRAAFEADLARNPALRGEFEELRALDAELRAGTAVVRAAGDAVAARTIRAIEPVSVRESSRLRIAAAIFGALLLGFAVAELMCHRPPVAPIPPPAAEPGPRITSLTGEAFLVNAFQKGGDPVARQMPWKVGDMLSTSNESAALAEMPDVAEIALGPESAVTRVDDLHYEFTYGHALVAQGVTAPTLSITLPAVAAEVFVDDGACELAYGSPLNVKKAGAVMVFVRAIAGPTGSARVRIRDRELRAGEAILVGDGFFRETGGADARDLRWYVDLLTARDR